MKNPMLKTKMIVGMLILVSLVGNVQANGWKKQNKSKGGVWMSEMNLTTQQMEKINTLRDEMQPAVMSIRHQNKTMELELKKLNRIKGDHKRIAQLNKSISANEQAIAALQKNHKAQVRALLTPEQQVQYDAFGSRSFAAKGHGRGQNNCGSGMNGPGNGRGKRG